jgi:hypothetical protein
MYISLYIHQGEMAADDIRSSIFQKVEYYCYTLYKSESNDNLSLTAYSEIMVA